MKFLAIERARETTMVRLVGVLRFTLMETVTETSTIKPTGLTNHAFAYSRQLLIYTGDVAIFPLLTILTLICVSKGTVSGTTSVYSSFASSLKFSFQIIEFILLGGKNSRGNAKTPRVEQSERAIL